MLTALNGENNSQNQWKIIYKMKWNEMIGWRFVFFSSLLLRTICSHRKQIGTHILPLNILCIELCELLGYEHWIRLTVPHNSSVKRKYCHSIRAKHSSIERFKENHFATYYTYILRILNFILEFQMANQSMI